MENTFKIGDIIELKSGSPKLLVTEICQDNLTLKYILWNYQTASPTEPQTILKSWVNITEKNITPLKEMGTPQTPLTSNYNTKKNPDG